MGKGEVVNTYSGGKFVEDLSVGWRWFRRGCYSEMYKKRRSGGEYSGRKFVEDFIRSREHTCQRETIYEKGSGGEHMTNTLAGPTRNSDESAARGTLWWVRRFDEILTNQQRDTLVGPMYTLDQSAPPKTLSTNHRPEGHTHQTHTHTHTISFII